jgi:Zn-finger nucleic acid-binding protein
MNFAAVDRRTVARENSHRLCPDCGIPLQTVRVDTGNGLFAIERCERCFGLFFDAGEVQAFLEASVAPSFAVNLQEITLINRERADFNRPVRYIRCPECGVLMNRVNYAAMSGVVIDQCKDHGVWLDNGELVHLMEWQKSGGELLARQARERQLEERQREARRPAAAGSDWTYPETGPEMSLGTDIVTTLLRVLFR